MSELAASMLKVNGFWNTKTFHWKYPRPVALKRGCVVCNILLCVMAVNALVINICSLNCPNWNPRKDAVEVEEDEMCLTFIGLPVRGSLPSNIWNLVLAHLRIFLSIIHALSLSQFSTHQSILLSNHPPAHPPLHWLYLIDLVHSLLFVSLCSNTQLKISLLGLGFTQ